MNVYMSINVTASLSLTSRRWVWGILQAHISPPAPGLPIALWSASVSESEAPLAVVTDRRSLENNVVKENAVWKNPKSPGEWR